VRAFLGRGLAGRKALGLTKAGAASDGPSEHGLERARARLAWIVGRVWRILWGRH